MDTVARVKELAAQRGLSLAALAVYAVQAVKTLKNNSQNH